MNHFFSLLIYFPLGLLQFYSLKCVTKLAVALRVVAPGAAAVVLPITLPSHPVTYLSPHLLSRPLSYPRLTCCCLSVSYLSFTSPVTALYLFRLICYHLSPFLHFPCYKFSLSSTVPLPSHILETRTHQMEPQIPEQNTAASPSSLRCV